MMQALSPLSSLPIWHTLFVLFGAAVVIAFTKHNLPSQAAQKFIARTSIYDRCSQTSLRDPVSEVLQHYGGALVEDGSPNSAQWVALQLQRFEGGVHQPHHRGDAGNRVVPQIQLCQRCQLRNLCGDLGSKHAESIVTFPGSRKHAISDLD